MSVIDKVLRKREIMVDTKKGILTLESLEFIH